MKLLFNDNLTNLSTTYNVSRGQYGFIMLRYAGTAQAAQDVLLSDLGNVILNHNGNDIINVDAELLSLLANIYGGAIEATHAVGGAFAYTIPVPVAAWFDSKNIFDVGENDKVYIKADFPSLTGAKVASGNIAIYAKPRKGIQSYFHKILSRSVVSGGSGIITDTINTSNISELYVKNPAALVSQVQITKDGNVFVDGDVASELAYSNWIHQLESSGTTLAVEFVESKDLREAVGQNLVYKYTFTGAGNLAQYYSAIEFSAQKQGESLQNSKRL